MPEQTTAGNIVAPREDALAHTVHAALVMHSLKLAKKPKQVSRSRYPMLVELDYGNRLATHALRWRSHYDELRSEVPRMISRIPRFFDSARSDGPLEARNLLEQIRNRLRGTLNEKEMELLAKFYGNRVSVTGAKQLAAQLREGLGVDIPLLDTNIRPLLEQFARENAALITSIPERMHQEIANLTVGAFQSRMGEETFAAKLEDIFDISEGRARMLARNQIGRITGQLSRARHQDLGIDGYFWRTRRDNRVRPKHRKREGKWFSYDEPPDDEGHPGEPYGCRCVEEPDLSDVLDAIAANRQFPGRFSAPLAGTLTGRGRSR